MKKIYSLVIAILITSNLLAQAPEKISYQAVIRNATNVLIAKKTIGIQISILKGTINGTVVYAETQTPLTNDNGLISLEIGKGVNVTGVFSDIDWSDDTYFIKTETDPTGGINYTISGVSQLMSVPYALHAKTASNFTGTITQSQISDLTNITDTQLTETQVDDFVNNNGYLTTEVDGSITNEIQDLSLSGNNLKITNNGSATTVDLSPFLDNTDTQLTETQVDGFANNNGYLTTEIDGSITNEIQDLSLSGNNLKITNNGSATTVDLSPFLDNIDTQLSESQVDAFTNNNGYLTTELDGSITNEIQDLSLAGNNLKITNNGSATTVDLSPFLDNTDTQLSESQVDDFVNNNGYITTEVDGSITNEIQDLSLVDNDLKITNNGSATTVDLSKYSELPSQTGNSGKFLTTNGTSPSWNTPVTPSLSDVLTKSNDGGAKSITNVSALGVGTATVTSGAAVEISSTTGGLLLPRLTSTQRDALAKTPGMVIFNKETGKFQGYQGFPESEILIDHNTFLGTLTLSGQSFTATETGEWTKLVLNFQAALAGGTLSIYNGNTVSGTPIHTQPLTVGVGVQEIILSASVNVVAGQQYSIFTNGACRYYPFATYAGGNSFTTTLAFPGDLWMKVILGKGSWVDLH